MTLRFITRIVLHGIIPRLCKASYVNKLHVVHVCSGCGRRLKENRGI